MDVGVCTAVIMYDTVSTSKLAAMSIGNYTVHKIFKQNITKHKKFLLMQIRTGCF